MDEELVKALDLVADNGSELCRRAAAEIRRLDVVIREGERTLHNEMYGRRSSSMVIPPT